MRIGMAMAIGARRRQLAASIKSLFSSGEQGVWYDPSDLSTLFQDAAGTTPVTAVEQPVGLMLDKSGRGNHATQTTSTSRPVLSARHNLLTKTEQFYDAAWGKQGVTLAGGVAVDPLGGNTASSVLEIASNSFHQVYVGSFPVASGVSHTVSFYVKANGRTKASIGFVKSTASFDGFTVFADLVTKTTTVTIAGAGTCTSHGIQDVGNGWFRVFGTGTIGANALSVVAVQSNNDAGANSYVGDAAKGIFIWGASLVPSNQADLPYQRVNTATDYDADPAKFKPYLKFDGVDDSMVTNSIDFTSTDKMTVFAGVRKLSDAVGIFAELSTSSATNNGTFNFATQIATGYSWRSRGTANGDVFSGPMLAPNYSVLTGIGDISGDSAIIRSNGAKEGQSALNQGTGNYGKYPLYIGRRGGTTTQFNGHLYSLIVRGAATTDTRIAQTERWVNKKTGAY